MLDLYIEIYKLCLVFYICFVVEDMKEKDGLYVIKR